MGDGPEQVDLVVAGGGIAGLTTALAAAETGAKVTLLERSDDIGGNARYSAGMLLGAKSADALHDYIPDGDLALQQLLCGRYDEVFAWLEALGLPLDPLFDFSDFRFVRPMGLGAPGRRQPFLRLMADTAEAKGVAILTSSPVSGVTATDRGFLVDAGDNGSQSAKFSTQAIVFATGGFQANRKLLATYLGEDAAEALMIRSHPHAMGDGLTLANGLGGGTSANLSYFYGHVMPDCLVPPEKWQPITPYFARLGILVNLDGHRFANESESLLEETNPQVACQQPGGIFYLLFDDAMYRGIGTDQGTVASLPDVDWFALAKEYGAPLMQADTLPGLIYKLGETGLPVETLTNEIDAYNAACQKGSADDLDTDRSANLIPFAAPPFYALRCRAGITATSGGIAIDNGCRITTPNGQPIPGLYAAGVDAGGVFGRTYGGFLGWSLVTGYVAGRSAVST